MIFLAQLKERSGNQCELCECTVNLSVYEVPPDGGTRLDNCMLICEKCNNQLSKKEELDAKHWTCLTRSMWSEVPAVQIVSWRLLNRLKNETWAADLIDQMYLDDDNLTWAKASGDHLETETSDAHVDCNVAVLNTGDTITLIKSLDVKCSQVNA